MKINDILSCVDHTLLSQTATSKQIFDLCDEAVEYNCASVCIPPSFVSLAKEYAGDKIRICTVIGFPNGYNSTAVKCFEAQDAVSSGADEIDMVINLGFVKDGKFDEILKEINAVKACCKGKTLKVIIETCLLDKNEKIKLCEIVAASDADYIKTSTGFSTGGATKEDIVLMTNHCKNKFVKAAGGISTLTDAADFIEAGAKRLGSSRIIKLVNNLEATDIY